MHESQEYVTVYEANGYLAGEIFRLLLEANDIPSLVVQESAGLTLGLTFGRLGTVKIMVPPDQLAVAQELIQAMEEGQLDETFYPGRLTNKPTEKENKLPGQEIYKD